MKARAADSGRWVILVMAGYGIISALGLHYHELFLDEAHHFLVSRDSGSIAEVYRNLRFDGHPRLWGVLLFLITHFITVAPAGMQVLQWVFAMASAYVLLRYAPFDRWTKLLLLAGYYFIFEYEVISRNYAIGIWMLFLCCHLLRDMERNAWRIGCLVLVMCSTHLFFSFAAVGILIFVMADRYGARVGVGAAFAKASAADARFWGMVTLVVLGLAGAAIQLQTPTADNANMRSVRPGEWLTWKDLSFSMNGLVQGWLPVPQVNGGRFWNTCWLTANHLGPVVPVVLFAALLLFPAVVLRKRLAALLFYYSTVGLLLLFFDITQMTADRYFGMVFLFFLAAAWLTADGTAPVLTLRAAPGERGWHRLWQGGWVGVLVVQAGVGGYALTEDFRRPFSQSRNTAEYLESLRPAGLPVIVDGYTAGPMLCAYLERRLYYLETGAPGSFCVWKKAYFPTPRPGIGQELEARPELRRLREFILVSNRRLGAEGEADTVAGWRIAGIQSFENSIAGENYYVYEVNPVSRSGASPDIKPTL